MKIKKRALWFVVWLSICSLKFTRARVRACVGAYARVRMCVCVYGGVCACVICVWCMCVHEFLKVYSRVLQPVLYYTEGLRPVHTAPQN